MMPPPARRPAHRSGYPSLSRWLLAFAAVAAARADVSLAPLFTDHLVLQRDKPAPVWGRGKSGEAVTVSFLGREEHASVGRDGRWTVLLPPTGATSAGSDLVVTGKNTLVLHDVVVGEVWFCAGESPLQASVGDCSRPGPGAPRATDAAAIASPLIRWFRIRLEGAGASGNEAWIPCARDTLENVPAVGYTFANELHRKLRIPIGIVTSTRGEAPIEACEAMAAPIVPSAIRGILWYQGASDVFRSSEYRDRFPKLILSWRAQFEQGDLPFFWVQLPSHQDARDPGGMSRAFLREAQASALRLPATGQAVTIDLGEPPSVHPENQQEIARRLALIAKATIYDIPSDYSGPVFKAAAREGPAMRVRFTFAGNGLTAAEKPLQAFELAGPDRRFFPASAALAGDTVVVRCPQVPDPVAVRYAWRNDPEANLFNGAGLPAAPFRSDDW